jgi:catechol 2,3-dioxygenase-like lactoylglutathione lyase family enzyme
MHGYVTLGTRNLPRAAKFYDRLARELGAGRSMETEDFVAWGVPGGPPGIGVAVPGEDGYSACETGVVALQAEDPDQVKRLFEIALSQGALAEEAPGDRGGGFYAAYFRDPDGNRLNAFCVTEH